MKFVILQKVNVLTRGQERYNQPGTWLYFQPQITATGSRLKCASFSWVESDRAMWSLLQLNSTESHEQRKCSELVEDARFSWVELSWVGSVEWSHCPIRFNSTCWVELSRIGQCDQGFKFIFTPFSPSNPFKSTSQSPIGGGAKAKTIKIFRHVGFQIDTDG
jgi:hypothetical protein